MVELVEPALALGCPPVVGSEAPPLVAALGTVPLTLLRALGPMVFRALRVAATFSTATDLLATVRFATRGAFKPKTPNVSRPLGRRPSPVGRQGSPTWKKQCVGW